MVSTYTSRSFLCSVGFPFHKLHSIVNISKLLTEQRIDISLTTTHDYLRKVRPDMVRHYRQLRLNGSHMQSMQNVLPNGTIYVFY